MRIRQGLYVIHLLVLHFWEIRIIDKTYFGCIRQHRALYKIAICLRMRCSPNFNRFIIDFEGVDDLVEQFDVLNIGGDVLLHGFIGKIVQKE